MNQPGEVFQNSELPPDATLPGGPLSVPNGAGPNGAGPTNGGMGPNSSGANGSAPNGGQTPYDPSNPAEPESPSPTDSTGPLFAPPATSDQANRLGGRARYPAPQAQVRMRQAPPSQPTANFGSPAAPQARAEVLRVSHEN
jgi:hypothetical protein